MKLAAKLLISIGLATAGLAALTTWRAEQLEARAEAEFPPEGQFVTVNGVQVHAVVMGHGPDVVLIHGSSGNTRDMTFALAPALAETYRVIVFDRPGLGYSETFNPDGETIFEQADILQKAAAQLGAERPIVVGQSYGGAVALAWAVEHPNNIAALVPVAAASNPWSTPLDLYNRIASHPVGSRLLPPLITAFVPDAFIDSTLDTVFAPQVVPEGYTSHFGPGLTLRRESMRANARQRANLLDELHALYPRYENISVPTEIIHGSADDTVEVDLHSDLLARQIPGANLTIVEDMGHMPQVVSVPEVVAAINRVAERAGLR